MPKQDLWIQFKSHLLKALPSPANLCPPFSTSFPTKAPLPCPWKILTAHYQRRGLYCCVGIKLILSHGFHSGFIRHCGTICLRRCLTSASIYRSTSVKAFSSFWSATVISVTTQSLSTVQNGEARSACRCRTPSAWPSSRLSRTCPLCTMMPSPSRWSAWSSKSSSPAWNTTW